MKKMKVHPHLKELHPTISQFDARECVVVAADGEFRAQTVLNDYSEVIGLTVYDDQGRILRGLDSTFASYDDEANQWVTSVALKGA